MSLWARVGKIVDEFEKRYRGRYYGYYRAVVVDNDDPQMHGRIRVSAPTIWGNRISQWIPPVLPMGSGGYDQGDFKIPPIRDAQNRPVGVFIIFDAGDRDHPMWTGGWMIAPATAGRVVEPETPLRARGEPDETVYGDKGLGFMPDSPSEPEYPYNRVTKTQGGFLEEVDDTAGKERYHRWHPAGTYLEVTSQGSEHRSIAGNSYTQVKGNRATNVLGSEKTVVGGTWTLEVGRGGSMELGGELLVYLGGRATEDPDPLVSVSAGASSGWAVQDWYLDALGDVTHKSGGAFSGSYAAKYSLRTGGNINFFAGGRNLQTTVKDAEEVIANVDLSSIGKKTLVNLGAYQVQVMADKIELFTGLSALAPFAMMRLGVDGSFSLENIAGFTVECDVAGNIHVNGLTVSVGPGVPVLGAINQSHIAPVAGTAGPFPVVGTTLPFSTFSATVKVQN